MEESNLRKTAYLFLASLSVSNFVTVLIGCLATLYLSHSYTKLNNTNNIFILNSVMNRKVRTSVAEQAANLIFSLLPTFHGALILIIMYERYKALIYNKAFLLQLTCLFASSVGDNVHSPDFFVVFCRFLHRRWCTA